MSYKLILGYNLSKDIFPEYYHTMDQLNLNNPLINELSDYIINHKKRLKITINQALLTLETICLRSYFSTIDYNIFKNIINWIPIDQNIHLLKCVGYYTWKNIITPQLNDTLNNLIGKQLYYEFDEDYKNLNIIKKLIYEFFDLHKNKIQLYDRICYYIPLLHGIFDEIMLQFPNTYTEYEAYDYIEYGFTNSCVYQDTIFRKINISKSDIFEYNIKISSNTNPYYLRINKNITNKYTAIRDFINFMYWISAYRRYLKNKIIELKQYPCNQRYDTKTNQLIFNQKFHIFQ